MYINRILKQHFNALPSLTVIEMHYVTNVGVPKLFVITTDTELVILAGDTEQMTTMCCTHFSVITVLPNQLNAIH